MGKYRKKPVVIDAIQWDGKDQTYDAICELAGQQLAKTSIGKLYMPTLEGELVAESGDWVIRGVKGEVYPCKPDIFEDIYEPATNKEMALIISIAELREKLKQEIAAEEPYRFRAEPGQIVQGEQTPKQKAFEEVLAMLPKCESGRNRRNG